MEAAERGRRLGSAPGGPAAKSTHLLQHPRKLQLTGQSLAVRRITEWHRGEERICGPVDLIAEYRLIS